MINKWAIRAKMQSRSNLKPSGNCINSNVNK